MRVATMMVVLALCGNVAWAGPGVAVTNARFDAAQQQFSCDVVFSGLDSSGLVMSGVAWGANFSGAGLAHLTLDPALNRYDGPTGQALVSPATYAWAWSASTSDSRLEGAAFESFVLIDEFLASATIHNGDLAGRLRVAWDGVATPLESIQIALQGDDLTTAQPYYFDAQGVAHDLEVVPEPATLSLLGLGLSALLARRHRQG